MKKNVVLVVSVALLLIMVLVNTILAEHGHKGKPSNAEVEQKTRKLQIPFVANEGQIDERVAFYARTFGGTVFVTKDGNIVYSLPHTAASPLVHYPIDKNETGYTGLTGYRGEKGTCIVHHALCTIFPFCTWNFPIHCSETNSLICHSERSEESHVNNSPSTRRDTEHLIPTTTVALKEEFIGAKVSGIKGEGASITKVSYFKGNDPSRWKTNIATYELVNLGEVYKGIELKLKAHGDNVEKLLYVKPGAVPEQIKISLSGIQPSGNPPPLSPSMRGTGGCPPLAGAGGGLGASLPVRVRTQTGGLWVNEHGELVAETVLGPVKFTKPIAYQEINGKRVDVRVEYRVESSEAENKSSKRKTCNSKLMSTNQKSAIQNDETEVSNPKSEIQNPKSEYGFIVASYDRTKDLIIDPLLASTFLGGSGGDYVYSLALDTSGNVYVTGITTSPDFPTTIGAYDTYGYDDVFVSKLDSGLTSLLASTYLGGNGVDYGFSLALDISGNVYVTGRTASSDFPTTIGAYDTSYNGGRGNGDVFVSKLDGGLTSLLASTYLGGSLGGIGCSLALDASGNVYVTGYTHSPDFPTTSGAYDTSQNGPSDVFVSKLNGGLTSLLASTYLGGSDGDVGYSLTFDASGNVYVTGYTHSLNFPTTSGAYNTSRNGTSDVFVSKLNGGLTSLLASTYLGGSGADSVYDNSLALDISGNVYVTGYTNSPNFPTTSGAYDTSYNGGNGDVFLSKLDSGLTSLLASTYLGGSNTDSGYSLALDTSGHVYVTGFTGSTDFPTTSEAYDSSYNGGYVFVSKLDGNLSASAATTPTPSPTPSSTASPKPTPSPTITPKVDSLLEKYAPILYMHPDERYYPTKVETMLNNSKLIQKRQFSTITVYENKDNTLTLDMLMSDKYNSKKHYLKLKEKSLKKIKNKTYWRKKEKVVYGRQFEANDNGIEKIVLQYWFFYIYNDWGKKTDFANVHEGDWEMIQIIFGSDKQPLLITFSYHEGGETFLWEKDKDKIDKSNDGNHPKVYVTLGGHGCWNKAGNHAWYQQLSGVCFDCEDETKKGDVLYPPNFPDDEIQTNYSKYPYILEDMSTWTEKDWIYWTGYWGNQDNYKGFTGPPSPPYIDYIKDDEYEGRWKEPFQWGVAPLPGNYQVCSSNNSKIIVYDLNGNVMRILKKCSPFVFTINSEKDLVFGVYSLDGEEVNLNISRFKRTTGEVCEVEFNWLEIPKDGKASFTFSPEQNPSLEMGIDHDMDGLFDSHRLPDYFEIK